ncbi:hypothetical protein GCM10007932_14850 [Vibrio penaeicida]|uniref:Uncharacterized protein n=1 Tax=Vibrio penaeicida TaxID=104609 RepID=A0AAV5NNV9_9VIBR|nr:hypothetical protein GCM10007932_14850 [Vibrio penaeicida]
MRKRRKLPEPIENPTLSDLITHNGGDLLVSCLREKNKSLSDAEFEIYIKKFRGSKKIRK